MPIRTIWSKLNFFLKLHQGRNSNIKVYYTKNIVTINAQKLFEKEENNTHFPLWLGIEII